MEHLGPVVSEFGGFVVAHLVEHRGQGPGALGAPGGDEDGVRRLRRIVLEAPPPLASFVPDVDPELAAIVGKAMAREPAERFASARAFHDALVGWLAEARRGVLRGVSVALHLHVATGIGGVLLAGGLPVTGAHGASSASRAPRAAGPTAAMLETWTNRRRCGMVTRTAPIRRRVPASLTARNSRSEAAAVRPAT